MSVAAVILCFNGAREIEACVDSLVTMERLEPKQDQILIVDNGSSDGSVERIRDLAVRHPGLVEPICLARNQGTTVPRNLAFARARADHLLMIDSDIRFEEPVLARLLRHFEADPGLGMVVPRLVFPDGRPQMSTDVFPTFGRKVERLFRLRALEREASERAGPEEVDYAISAFWLLKREVLDRVGGLDPKIFYAPEDVDFCLRLWLSGYRLLADPAPRVIHDAKERSRSLRGLVFTVRHVLGLLYYFKKHRYLFSTDRLRRRIERAVGRSRGSDAGGDARLQGSAS